MLIKLLAAEADLTSASNVGNATVVRLFNSHTAEIVITRTDSSDSAIGSITVNTKESVILEKDPTDKLSAASQGSAQLVTKIAYAN